MSIGSELREGLNAIRRRAAKVLGFYAAIRRKIDEILNPGMFTYFIGMPVAEVDPGKPSVVSIVANEPFQIIDVVMIGPRATFDLLTFHVGDANMLLGTGGVPADMFFPEVQNRFVRFTTVKMGQTIAVQVRNTSKKKATLITAIKVRAYRRAS
jgi:hypothetical protein